VTHQTRIIGRKGGKGGGASQPYEAPNSLRSRSTARSIDLISEGPIRGLKHGHRSIFLNGTQLQNDNGTYNFDGVSVSTRVGTPDQDYMPGFSRVEIDKPVGVQVTQAAPFVFSITDDDADAVRVTVRIPSLMRAVDDTGDIVETEVRIKIDVRESGSVYLTKVDDTIAGKTVSPYERSYRISLPQTFGAPWDIRVIRVTPDSDSAKLNNETYVSRYTELYEHKLIYPDCALVGLEVDAEKFGGTIPKRTYELEALEIQVPSNYDPETRSYSGIWDGTFKLAVTDNAAWVAYDLVLNDRYGMAQYAPGLTVDKWTMYEIAQYCDELVPDGQGGQRPRHTFNGVIRSEEEAYHIVQSVASTFNAMLHYGSNQVVFSQDKPGEPVKLVTPANVIDGKFDYQGVGLRARHSVVLVQWQDPEQLGEPAIEVVEDVELIEKRGYKPLKVVALGCNNRAEAHYKGRWILDNEKYAPDAVTYRASWDHVDVVPGDIIAIADPSYAGVRYGGRIIAADDESVTIDQEVELDVSEAYELSVVLPDDTVESREIYNGAGVINVLRFNDPFSTTPHPGAMWVLSGSNVEPRQFRVISVRETERGQVEINGAFHDPNKYERIYFDRRLPPASYSTFPTGPLLKPIDLEVREYIYASGTTLKTAAFLSWSKPNDPRVTFFEIEVKRPGGSWTSWGPPTQTLTVDLGDTVLGVWEFRVRSLATFAGQSDWTTHVHNMVGEAAPPSDVDDFDIQIVGDQAFLTWDPVPDLDVEFYRIRHTPQLINASWENAVVLINKVPRDLSQINVPARTGTYLIKAVDRSGTASVNATAIVVRNAGVFSLNVVENVDEHISWGGTHDGTRLLNNAIELDPDADGDYPSGGTYAFAASADLGQVYKCRLGLSMLAAGKDVTNTMDSWSTLVDLEKLAGGDSSQWDVDVQVRTTQDDPAGTPTWTDWNVVTVSDYEARAFEFRVVLTSLAVTVTPSISELSVQVDMPDRVLGQDDVTSQIGGTTITFSPAFKNKPAIAVTGQDMATGDYFTLTGAGRTGFTVEFFDSGGSSISRTFDWIAKGYGEEKV